MKNCSTILLIAGVACIIAGIYGMVQVGNMGFSGGQFDSMMNMISGSGAPSLNSLPVLITRYRTALLVGGLLFSIVGVVMRRRASGAR